MHLHISLTKALAVTACMFGPNDILLKFFKLSAVKLSYHSDNEIKHEY